MKLLLLWTAFFAVPCFAQSGADVLLNQLDGKTALPAAKTKSAKSRVATIHSHPTGDAFQQQLELQVQNERRLPFDVREWTDLVLDSEYVKAAHLWTAIQMQIPEKFRNQAEATQLYLLWKLGLNQTFLDQWIRNLANTSYAESTPEQVLESLVTPNLDGWLLQTPLIISSKQQTILSRLPTSDSFVLTLKAWSEMRQESKADELLAALPPDSKLARYVADTAVYSHVRKSDLKGAAKILKDSVEPVIEATQDLDLLAKHDVSIARILYQAGQMRAAGEFYAKIPNRSAAYLSAREELSWVYLRQGDMTRLRGEIKALSSPLFKDRFQPETYLLRAVSDLKMCFYDLLDKDLNDFSKSNSVWAKKIDVALASAATPAPTVPDEYTQMSMRTTKYLESEAKMISQLGDQSIGAALPAVGWQKHWKDYQADVQAAVEEARKHQTDEFQRQWKNDRSALQEAIRKMRFVKVEYLSQVRTLSAVDGTAPKLVASNENASAAEILKNDKDQLSFPATSEIWPDELFKLRSAAQAQCLKKSGGQHGQVIR